MTDVQEHDNSHLKIYLKVIADAEEAGDPIDKDATDEAFLQAFQASERHDDAEFLGANKIRQTMYIAKLARKVGTTLVLTDKGRELLEA